MGYTQDYKLMSLSQLQRIDDDAVGCYHIVNILDTLCCDKRIYWNSFDVIEKIKQYHEHALNELIIHSVTIIARSNQHINVNILPLVEAGYLYRYDSIGTQIRGINWITPVGILRLTCLNNIPGKLN